MAAPDEPTRLVEVPIVDDSFDDSRSRSVSEEERRRRCAAFAALNETFVLGTTTTRRDSHDALDRHARGQVFAAAAAVETPAAVAREPREGTSTPPVRDTTPRAAEDSPNDDSAHDDADAPKPAFTKSEVAGIVAMLGFLDASQQSIVHGIMRREHADEPPEDLMKLSPNALAQVDEYVRELLLLPSRADSRDLTDVVAEMRTANAKVKAKAKAKANANPAEEKNPYELQREANIARNKAAMASLNIRSLAGAVQPSRGGKRAASPNGSHKRRAENSEDDDFIPGDAEARGTPKGASAGASNTRPRRKAVAPKRLILTFGSARSYSKEEPEDEEDPEDEEEPEDEEDAECLYCGESECPEGDDFILCDMCNKGGHVRACVGLSEVPTGSWYCSDDCLHKSVAIPSLKYRSANSQSATVPGLKYIRFYKQTGRYGASIKVAKGHRKGLGGFDTVPEAVAAYNEVAVDHGIATQQVPSEYVVSPEPKPVPKPCLLYTSPSPRDATLSRMPSSA